MTGKLEEVFIGKMVAGKKKAVKEVKVAALVDLLLIVYCFCWACYDGGWTLFWFLVSFIFAFSTAIIWARNNFYLGFNEERYRSSKEFLKEDVVAKNSQNFYKR